MHTAKARLCLRENFTQLSCIFIKCLSVLAWVKVSSLWKVTMDIFMITITLENQSFWPSPLLLCKVLLSSLQIMTLCLHHFLKGKLLNVSDKLSTILLYIREGPYYYTGINGTKRFSPLAFYVSAQALVITTWFLFFVNQIIHRNINWGCVHNQSTTMYVISVAALGPRDNKLINWFKIAPLNPCLITYMSVSLYQTQELLTAFACLYRPVCDI